MKIIAKTINELLEILNKRHENEEWEYDDYINYIVCIEYDGLGIVESYYSYLYDEEEPSFTLKHEF